MMCSSKTSPERCSEIRENISAQFDCEVQSIESAEISQHIAHCVDCAQFKSALHMLDTRLREEFNPSCNSDKIWHDVVTRIEVDEVAGSPEVLAKSPRVVTKGRIVFALVASILIGVFVTRVPASWFPQTQLAMAAETIRDYETFRDRGFQLDIEVNDSDELVKWMSGKIDFDLPREVRPPSEYLVAGGRICSFLNRRLAFFQYERDEHTLSLYVMPSNGLYIPNGGKKDTNTDENGLTTVTWKRSELAYVIVSDLPAEQVIEFASRT